MHRRSLTLALASLVAAGSWAIATPRAGDGPGPVPQGVPPGLADRAWAITDAVLGRHVDPPARQAMLLAGIKSLRRAAGRGTPAALARKASDLIAPGQYAALLAEAWPTPNAQAGSDEAGPPDSPADGLDRRGPSADGGTLEDALIEGLLAAVPGGAELISAKDLKVADQVAGNLYVGVQIALSYDEKAKRSVIAKILEGGPADLAGAKEGDQIEAVDGVDAVGLPLKAVVDRLRGELGSRVVVRIKRPEVADPLTLPMTRGILPRKTVEGHHRRADGGWDVRLAGPEPIGYLKISEIVGSTPSELRSWAGQLEADGAKAVVLDLRGLSHSGLHAAVLLADALLDGGPIGRVRSADSVKTYRAEADALFLGWPIAVIMNGAASPEARWLAAALEDNGRASVVNSPTGAVPPIRTAVELPGGAWSVLMATGRLERGDGRPLSAVDPAPGPQPRPRMPKSFAPADRLEELNYNIAGVPKSQVPAGQGTTTAPLSQAVEILTRALKTAGSR